MMGGSEATRDGEAFTKYELTLADAREARPLTFLHAPETPGAEALVGAVTEQVAAWERRKRARGDGEMSRLRDAVGAALGGLLTAAWAGNGLVYRSMNKNTFAGERVGYRQAKAALDGLKALGLVRLVPGIRYDRLRLFEGAPSWEGTAARFAATEALKALAASHGLEPDTIKADFSIQWPAQPPQVREAIQLRPLSEKRPGEKPMRREDNLPLDKDDPATARLVADVEAANAVLAAHRFERCTPPALYRVFRRDFTLGGRWITAGVVPIQQMRPDDRLRICVDGQPVAEVDVKASQLSILAAFAGVKELAFDDPYAFPDEPWSRLPNAREVVKSLVVAALGAGKLPTRWPNGMRDRLKVPHSLGVGDITAALAVRFPFLRRPAEVLGVAPDVVALRLQALEANVITGALSHAWSCGIPAVPVHDSIIVPQAAARMVETDLQIAYRVRCNGAVIRTVTKQGA